jgi:hypothetical protein
MRSAYTIFLGNPEEDRSLTIHKGERKWNYEI